jgi:hypothetical protein
MQDVGAVEVNFHVRLPPRQRYQINAECVTEVVSFNEYRLPKVFNPAYYDVQHTMTRQYISLTCIDCLRELEDFKINIQLKWHIAAIKKSPSS